MSAAQPDPLALADKTGDDLAFLRAIAECAAERGPIQIARTTASDMVAALDRIAATLRNDGSQREAGYRAGIEAAAKVIQKRMDDRFNEHGTREWDTNACYYTGAAAETYEALDEEADELIAAIRALEPKGE